ncbi:MAG: twin-arginine translocation pathway signal protein [Pseudomonadota bacterium]
MVSRRTVLKTGGAVAVIGGLAAAGTVGWVHGPGQTAAREPWSHAGESFGDARIDALAYAILAPNPHNRQPWMFQLVGEDQIDVYCDLDKRLPHTDPFDRQITIGFGCMLELLSLAAAEQGLRADIQAFPDGEPQPRLSTNRIASVRLIKSEATQSDPLFTSVLQRRSTKEPFDTSKRVTPEALNAVMAGATDTVQVGGTVDREQVQRLIDLCWRGWLIEYETPRTLGESVDLMRIGNREVVANPDGIDMGGLQMGLFKTAGIVTREALRDPDSQAYKIGIDMYRDIIQTACGFVWISVPEHTRLSEIEAGRSWVRMNLAAQEVGLCIHPLSQILQEFPEMAEPYRAIRQELEIAEPGVVHMLGRVGYTEFPPPSPRWPLTSKLIRS